MKKKLKQNKNDHTIIFFNSNITCFVCVTFYQIEATLEKSNVRNNKEISHNLELHLVI